MSTSVSQGSSTSKAPAARDSQNADTISQCSASPVADNSRSVKRKGKQKALGAIDVPPNGSDTIRTYEGSSSTHVSPEAAASVSSSGLNISISQDSSAAEAPAARDSQNATLSHAIADDPAAAFARMMSQHSSIAPAHDAPADVPSSTNVPPSASGAPFLEDFAFPSIPNTSARTATLTPTTDRGQLPHSTHTEHNDTDTTPKAEAQLQRPVDTVPIDEVEPLAAYTCPICFSPPSHATITPCGHVLCGECLFTAVKTTIQRGAYTLPAGERMTARCPICSSREEYLWFFDQELGLQGHAVCSYTELCTRHESLSQACNYVLLLDHGQNAAHLRLTNVASF
ncbi:hypothetical protein V8D89_001778 [Ganoderma adspersum]